MILEYHSALHPTDRWPPKDRAESASGVAFVHDICVKPLTNDYLQADVFYSDLPWRHGFEEFERRAGHSYRTYPEFMQTVSRIIDHCVAPVVLVTGRHAMRYLPKPDELISTKLNNGKCLALAYRANLGFQEIADTNLLLYALAARFECVGDFCCGYGRAGMVFAQRGKRYVMSDYNPSCIGYIAEVLK